jgi:XTP/dITP diphosphohydrolase
MTNKIIQTSNLKRSKKLKAFNRLLTIMDQLRESCPWDKKQTMESLRNLTIEEAYELSEAIIDGDLKEVEKELGDLMLHLTFYAKLGSEKNAFDMETVLNGICDKLIRRHPHIYSDTKVEDEDTVKKNWEKIKLKEMGNTSVLGGVPQSLPALIKAMRIQEKASGIGFDWEKESQIWDKIEEEIKEFKVELQAKTKSIKRVNEEFGDILFSLINYARFQGIDPEDALERTNKKFIKRFQYLEKQSKKTGKLLTEMTLLEMDAYWENAKKNIDE